MNYTRVMHRSQGCVWYRRRFITSVISCYGDTGAFVLRRGSRVYGEPSLASSRSGLATAEDGPHVPRRRLTGRARLP